MRSFLFLRHYEPVTNAHKIEPSVVETKGNTSNKYDALTDCLQVFKSQSNSLPLNNDSSQRQCETLRTSIKWNA